MFPTNERTLTICFRTFHPKTTLIHVIPAFNYYQNSYVHFFEKFSLDIPFFGIVWFQSQSEVVHVFFVLDKQLVNFLTFNNSFILSILSSTIIYLIITNQLKTIPKAVCQLCDFWLFFVRLHTYYNLLS